MRAVELSPTTLSLEQDGRVLVARVTDPPHNYMTATMQSDLLDLVRAVEGDASVGAVVLTGGVEGRFITHYSIPDLLEAADSAPERLPAAVAGAVLRGADLASGLPGGEELVARTPASGLQAITRFHDIVLGVMSSPAVWLAAVDGPCGGGGLELIVHFDVRIAGPSARFVLPELLIGLTTTVGGQRLAQLMGPSAALEFMLEGRPFDAGQARAAGLVGTVTDEGAVLDEALERAHRYARRNRDVVGAQKRLLNEAHSLTPAQSLHREGVAQVTGIGSATTRAALREWVAHQERTGDGDSVFLTDPAPWVDGTAVDLNPSPR